MDTPLPFDLTTLRVELHGGLVQLVLVLDAEIGLLWASCGARGRWVNVVIGRS
jgi:hypothetical protein